MESSRDAEIMRLDFCGVSDISSNKEDISTNKENTSNKEAKQEQNTTELQGTTRKPPYTVIKTDQEKNNDRKRRTDGKRVSQQEFNTLTKYRSRSALNMKILEDDKNNGMHEKTKKNSTPEPARNTAEKLINTENRRSNSNRVLNQKETKECKEACCNNSSSSKKIQGRCNCSITTTIEAIAMPCLTIHNRKSKYTKKNICPVRSNSRKNIINQIKRKFQRKEGPMVQEEKCSKNKNRRIELNRMWHYTDNAAYIIKQTGSREDMRKLYHELTNIALTVYSMREQLQRIQEAEKMSNNTVEITENIKKAEIQESTLAGEWIIKQNKQVKHFIKKNMQILTFFRKMSNIESMLNNLGNYPATLQKLLGELLTDLKSEKTKNIAKMGKELKTFHEKILDESEKVKKILQTIDKHSPEPWDLGGLYEDIFQVLGEDSDSEQEGEQQDNENLEDMDADLSTDTFPPPKEGKSRKGEHMLG